MVKANATAHTLYPNVFTSLKSIQKFQEGIKLSKQLIHELLEIASLAPSTWNLQHWRFVAIQNQSRKQRLTPIAYHQQQVLDCSTVIVVLGDQEAYLNAENILNQSVKQGFITQQTKEDQLAEILNSYKSNVHFRQEEAIRNASLAGMQLMLVARDEGVDSCMLRFDSKQLSEELRLPSRYLPVMFICIGYAAKAPKPFIRNRLEETLLYDDLE